MKKLAMIASAILLSGISIACTTKGQTTEISTEDRNVLICYFSATGTTENAAKRIAMISGYELHNIEPSEPYSETDLNWRDSMSRCYIEMHNRTMRPALKDTVTDIAAYSIILLGYPNWWNTYPNIISSFIEANQLEGKTIVPFMTSGGSNITNSEKELHDTYPSLEFAPGLLMNNVSDDDIRDWLKQIEKQ